MNLTTNMAWAVPMVPIQRVATTASATQDCRGYDRVRIWAQKLNTSATGNKNPKIIFRVKHCTSTNTFASGTAFATALALSSAAASTTRALGFDIDMAGAGGYLTMLLSHATGSGISGVFCQPYNSKVNPTGTSTTGISGFQYLTYSPAQP